MGDFFDASLYPFCSSVCFDCFDEIPPGSITSREFYSGPLYLRAGAQDFSPHNPKLQSSAYKLQQILYRAALLNHAARSPLDLLEEAHVLARKESQNSGSSFAGKVSVNEERLYINALRAAAAGGFQEADKFRIEDIFYNLKQCGAVSKTFREFVQSGGKAKDTEDSSNPSALIYTSIVNNRFEETFSENALEWHEYFFGMRLFENFDWDCIPLDAFGDSVLTLMKCRVDKKIVSDSKKHICPFNYVEQVGEIADALDILRKAGAEKVSKNNISLYDSIRLGMKSNIREYFDPDLALDTINNVVLRHDADSVKTSLSVMRFVKEVTGNALDNKLSRILENYENPNHLWYKIDDGYERRKIRGKILELRKQVPKPKRVVFVGVKPKR